jgi:dTDP-4-amino-4,6-dideoxygalactose transaminase
MALKPRGKIVTVVKGIASAVTPTTGNGLKQAKSFKGLGAYLYGETCNDNTGTKRFKWKLGDLPVGYGQKYIESRLRHDLEVTDLQVTLELPKFSKLNQFVVVRRRNSDHLFSRLGSVRGLIPPRTVQNSEPSWFGCLITLGPDSGLDPDEITNTRLVMQARGRVGVYPRLTISIADYISHLLTEFVKG